MYGLTLHDICQKFAKIMLPITFYLSVRFFLAVSEHRKIVHCNWNIMASMLLLYNQSYIETPSSEEKDQFLVMGGLIWVGIFCLVPSILFFLLISTLCCNVPWDLLVFKEKSFSGIDEESKDDIDHYSIWS